MREPKLYTGKIIVTNFFNTIITLAFWCGLLEFFFFCFERYGVLEAVLTMIRS